MQTELTTPWDCLGQIDKNRSTRERICGTTSLPKNKKNAVQPLSLIRRHWEIENCLHYVRDVTFGEDRCRVRNRNKAQILAALRNLSITLFHYLWYENIAEGIEVLGENKQKALRLVRWGRAE
jgi:hypothetical protein